MTIQQKIIDFEDAFGKKLPTFYVDFIIQHHLENNKLFNDLTQLYGLDELLYRQSLIQTYLPNHLNIGNDGSGTHCGETSAFSSELSNKAIEVNTIPLQDNQQALLAIEHYFRKQKGRFKARFLQLVANAYCKVIK